MTLKNDYSDVGNFMPLKKCIDIQKWYIIKIARRIATMFEEIFKKTVKLEIDQTFVEDVSFEAESETPKVKEKEVKQNFGQILF